MDRLGALGAAGGGGSGFPGGSGYSRDPLPAAGELKRLILDSIIDVGWPVGQPEITDVLTSLLATTRP